MARLEKINLENNKEVRRSRSLPRSKSRPFSSKCGTARTSQIISVISVISFYYLFSMFRSHSFQRQNEHLTCHHCQRKPVDDRYESKLHPILEATVNLIDIHVTKLLTNGMSPIDYDDIDAEFCALDWNLYKSHPWKLPMYRDIVANSEGCRSGRIVVNLKSVIEQVRLYDQQQTSSARTIVKQLDPKFIFHESRCGSTLLANYLVYSSPEEVRLYSEAAPPLTALNICGQSFEFCSEKTAASIFHDVVYLMGRVRSEKESHLFFKLQSSATFSLDIVRKAFPVAPWVFLYRDPEEVMVSHLNIPKKSRAKCLQSRRNPPSRVRRYLESMKLDLGGLSHEEYCAIYLSMICKSAAEAIKTGGHGKLLSYNHNLLDQLIDNVIPAHFGLPLSSKKEKLLHYTSQIYSKSRGNENLEWVEDSTAKHDIATDATRQASSFYLASSYLELEALWEAQGQ
jgi:hypothetical protein